jgi:hypothetical protein
VRERIRYEPLSGRDAPVISDEGTFGTPMPRPPAPAERGAERRAWLALALTAVVSLWLGAFSLWQVTARAVALPVAERGLASIAEIDALLTLHAGELCAQAGSNEAVQVEGFPIPDVAVRGTELSCADGVLDRAALRTLLLQRGAERIYLRGDEAFTESGRTADSASLFSGAGLVRRLLDSIGTSTHQLAALGTWGLGGVSALLALVLLAAGARRRRVAALGGAMMLSALPVIGAALGLKGLLSVFGNTGESDAMLREFVAITNDLAWLPLRNALILAACGLLLVAPVVLSRRAREDR